MDNELTVIGSELPVLQAKGTYKYLKEITGNGAYYQVAWQKLADGYIDTYDTTPIQIKVSHLKRQKGAIKLLIIRIHELHRFNTISTALTFTWNSII
ncbi:hypothetical protein A7322_12680 [Lentilactobacillus parabuchneri]|uniref:hypothetical protein n=1 Tax=Lentilactobacillus parabuchneri TaxID=152331 RepID=UPI00080BE008|nr:hypothetical protein [Lentilactobacillus parabuchneri]OCB80039.1 hypothetical protein A7322_12680 [Lentilactobacillus parabuchneri]